MPTNDLFTVIVNYGLPSIILFLFARYYVQKEDERGVIQLEKEREREKNDRIREERLENKLQESTEVNMALLETNKDLADSNLSLVHVLEAYNDKFNVLTVKVDNIDDKVDSIKSELSDLKNKKIK